jgi:hypothetical protein
LDAAVFDRRAGGRAIAFASSTAESFARADILDAATLDSRVRRGAGAQCAEADIRRASAFDRGAGRRSGTRGRVKRSIFIANKLSAATFDRGACDITEIIFSRTKSSDNLLTTMSDRGVGR